MRQETGSKNHKTTAPAIATRRRCGWGGRKVIKSYKDLEVYQIAKSLDHQVYKISLTFPKFELYELGRQARESAHSAVSNIVEGYGRKIYETEFKRFLIFALASVDETKEHLEAAFERGYIKEATLKKLVGKYEELGRKINRLIANWKSY